MDFVEVTFSPGGSRVLVRPGTTLLEAGRLAGVEIVTGCTRGMCGTDPVRVCGDGAGMEPAAEPECFTLERMGLGPGIRLSCSARVRSGPLRVELDVS